MNSYVCSKELNIDSNCAKKLEQLYHYYIQHKFDLLGSGFVKIDYNLRAGGVHGRRYADKYMQNYGQRVFKNLKKYVNRYEPINWFVDYKSGYFFNPVKYNSSEKCLSMIGKIPGVDIKCPWELGRLHHLLQMAILATIRPTYKDDIILEFKNEMIDFWETNPIGRTVQWSIAMDVSIRLVNLLVAYDLLRQVDEKKYLDAQFEKRFKKHIYLSLRFVMEHLEYIDGAGTNHYLANLAGIIFAAAYLDSNEWVDACLVFGVQELVDQTKKQFFAEGSNFEGSVSYHRLSVELVLYPTALVFGVLNTNRRKVFKRYNSNIIERLKDLNHQKYNMNKKDFFPIYFINRLYNMEVFTREVTKDNGEIMQVGDNDSGRLLKLTPMHETTDKNMKENTLDHRTLLSALGGLFEDETSQIYCMNFPLECSFVKAMSGSERKKGEVYDTLISEYGKRSNVFMGYPYRRETVLYKDALNVGFLENVKINYFSRFGIVILRSNRIFLGMVIDTAMNVKYAGHTHNDKLSIELMVDGQYITRDSGTYLYTAIPEIRDKFRSAKAHNTIHVAGKEQNIFNGVFGMEKRTKAELLYCCKDCIIAKARYGGVEHVREIRIEDCRIVIIDYANTPFTVAFVNKMYSTGYGELTIKAD